MHSGSCLCGAVRFKVRGQLPQPNACHCVECRKQTGHYLVSVGIPREALAVEGLEALRTWLPVKAAYLRPHCVDQPTVDCQKPHADQHKPSIVPRGQILTKK
jgi:hypothetical protein